MSLFVTIEGIEGSGKSTLQKRLAEFYQNQALATVVTHEPGGTALGKLIRQVVLDPESKNLTAAAELMMFAADRAQHIAEVIRPAIERGDLIICDRFLHSTLAYQGYGRGMNLEQLAALQEIVCAGIRPDLVLLLDLPVEAGLNRATKRGAASWNRFEAQEKEFHQRVHQGFLTLAKDPKQNILVVDANQSPEQISQLAIEAIEKLRGKHARR